MYPNDRDSYPNDCDTRIRTIVCHGTSACHRPKGLKSRISPTYSSPGRATRSRGQDDKGRKGAARFLQSRNPERIEEALGSVYASAGLFASLDGPWALPAVWAARSLPCSTCITACWTNRSSTVGMPSFRTPPSGLGISTRLTGNPHRLPRAPPDLQPVPLMDMGFAVICPLA
jgi:hypothetical protein